MPDETNINLIPPHGGYRKLMRVGLLRGCIELEKTLEKTKNDIQKEEPFNLGL